MVRAVDHREFEAPIVFMLIEDRLEGATHSCRIKLDPRFDGEVRVKVNDTGGT